MIIKPILKLASAVVLLGALGTANANTISLSPADITADPGQLVSFDVIMDFTSVTIGGGFDITYDSAVLSFDSWNPNAVGDPGFARLPDISDGLLSGIAVGDFNLGVTGLQNLGTVSFIVNDVNTRGLSGMVGLQDTMSVAGPFVDIATFQIITPDYVGASVNVNVGAVPVPAAMWLMFGGLGALFGFGRKRA